MKPGPAALAAKREALLERSAGCRLRLHQDARAVRESLHGPRAAGNAALSLAGYVALAGRILVMARLARSLIGYLRGR
jgi:hypothetical protein